MKQKFYILNILGLFHLRGAALEQNLEKNKSDILHLANEKNLGKLDFVEEKISGKTSWKQRRITVILQELKQDDVILLSEFSRLGRSMLECMEIISRAVERGIKIYTVKGCWQLDNTIQSKVIAMVFSMASEIELDLISKRTTEARASVVLAREES